MQRPDNPLSPRGLEQAARLAGRLAGEGLRAIVSSDYARAVQTAAELARVTGLSVHHDPLLRERDFGDIRGTPYAELGFDMFALDYAPPNGETWEIFHARVDRAWALVRERAAGAGGHLAVVTHGLVCRSLAGRHLVLPDGTPVPERWENTAVTIIEAPPGIEAPPRIEPRPGIEGPAGRAPGWRVTRLNCVAHLEDDPAARSLGSSGAA